MITEIRAEPFKGKGFKYPLARKNFFVGPNGSGKSSVSEAISLLVLGYVPGHAKTNQAIIDAFGDGESLEVTGTCNDIELARVFRCTEKSGVTQRFKVNGKAVPKGKFIENMVKAGNPQVFDVAAFMAMSSQDKIEMLFDRFPPAEDIEPINRAIEQLGSDIKKLHQNILGNDKAIRRMEGQKAQLNLPAGGLSETKDRIAKLEGELAGVTTDIDRIEQEEKRVAAEEQRKKLEESQRPDPPESSREIGQYGKGVQEQRPALPSSGFGDAYPKTKPMDPGKSKADVIRKIAAGTTVKGPVTLFDEDSTQIGVDEAIRVLEDVRKTMDEGGCETCVAQMLIKSHIRELSARKQEKF